MGKPVVKVFISYAHADGKSFAIFKNVLTTHLKSASQYEFDLWDDSKIMPGSKWDEEIQNRLAAADLAILCVSGNFLVSDYIKDNEAGNLFTKYPGVMIFPVYFNHCNFTALQQLAEKQFFKPSGKEFGKDGTTFCFCDLLPSTPADNDLISSPGSMVDKYCLALVAKLEESITEWRGKLSVVKDTGTARQTVYINPSNYPYFEKDNFFGREELLKQLDETLKGLDIPLLLSGIGGMGKTTAAIAYGRTPEYASTYDHIAWVSVTDNLFNNLFSTFRGNAVLRFEYDAGESTDQTIAAMMQQLRGLSGNNLLVIDNVNNEEDLNNFIGVWKVYQPGWKCIITTRCENSAYTKNMLRLQVLSVEAAEKLYRGFNKVDDFDADSFKKIYDYIGGHTFLVELLAKYAAVSSKIDNTDQLLENLVTKGIKALTRTVKAAQGQLPQSDKTVSEFVSCLYEPQKLSEKQKIYMRYFSVLPAIDVEFNKLVLLFGVEENDEDNFDETLQWLAKNGWLTHNRNSFKCNQIIQEICRDKLKPDENNCIVLLQTLGTLFGKKNLQQAVSFFELAYSISIHINAKTEEYAAMQMNLADLSKQAGDMTYVLPLLFCAKDIYAVNNKYIEALCNEKIGDVYMMQKDLEESRNTAMQYYNEESIAAQKLASEQPGISANFDLLAITFFKKGEVYQAANDKEKAMKNFTACLDIEKKLTEQYPEVVQYNNNLVGTFSKIGELHLEDNKPEEAKKYYTLFNETEEDLVKRFPDNREFRNNLSISYCKLGEYCEAVKDMGGAAIWYTKYTAIKKELADTEPENVALQNTLAVSYTKMMKVSAGDEKKKYLLQAKEIWGKLAMNVQWNTEYQNNLDWVNNRLKELE